MGAVYLNSCPKCEGAVVLDYEQEAVCLNCGNRNFHKVNLLIKIVEQAKKSLLTKERIA